MNDDGARHILHALESGDRIVLNDRREVVAYASTFHDKLRREVGLESNKVLTCTPRHVKLHVPRTPPDDEGFKRRTIRNLSVE